MLQILESACVLTIEQLEARMHRLTERMSQHEDYDVIASSHKAGLPLLRLLLASPSLL